MRIKHCIRFILCSILLLSCFSKGTAQVNVQDSLALVALYNKIPALANDTTWLNGNVSNWNGVSVFSNRVQYLDLSNVVINDSIPREICALNTLFYLGLSNCQLKGKIPSCIIGMSTLGAVFLQSNGLDGVEQGADFSQLTQLQNFFIANNLFSEMPDFMSIPSPVLNAIDVRSNYFNFDDLIPLTSKGLLQYFYDSQHEVSSYYHFNVNLGSSADFPDASLLVTGIGNTYNWRVLDIGDSTYTPPPSRFSGVNTPVLHVDGVQFIDNKLYHCEMTNPNLPGLVLKTGVVDMTIIDPLLPQTITYLGDTIAYCADSLLVLAATTTSGHAVSFVSLTDYNSTVNPDNTLSIYRTGTATIRATTPADATYHADTLLIPIIIATHLPLPYFQSNLQSPSSEGDDLKISIQYFPEFTYQWMLPNGQTYDSSALTISPFTVSDVGRYEMRVTEGTCLHTSLIYTIDSFPYGKLTVYELITPNGDGDNETFYIENLNPSVQNEVSVFNAVHQIVYHKENYHNDWDGGDLPVGSYYYSIKYGEQTYKGNLYIKR